MNKRLLLTIAISITTLATAQRPKIMTIGGATQDVFIQSADLSSQKTTEKNNALYVLLKEGTKKNIDDITYVPGGGAINTALAFSKLDCNTSIFAKMGNDPERDYLINFLQKNDIQTKWCPSDPTTQTARSFILPTPHGDNIVCCYRASNKKIQEGELPLKAIASQDCVYITSLSGESYRHLPTITHHARKMGTFVIVNPGLKQMTPNKITTLIEAMHSIDLFMLNSSEAQKLYCALKCNKKWPDKKIAPENCPQLLSCFCRQESHEASIIDYMRTIHEHGPRIIVVTNGAEGVYVSDKKTLYFLKSIPTQMVSSTGAGDAFGSCFVASIAHDLSIEAAMLNGSINSASVIQKTSAHEGQCSFEQIDAIKEKLLTENKLPEIYTFSLDDTHSSC